MIRVALDDPFFPLELVLVWQWFNELHSSRQSNGTGMCPLSYTEIHSWCTLTGIAPSPWEVNVLIQIDKKFMKSLTSKVR